MLERRFDLLDRLAGTDSFAGMPANFAESPNRQTSRGVAEIASDVGYESEAAFNRAFKREFGLPPGRYRSEHKERLVP